MNNSSTILQLKIPVKLAAHVIALREKRNVYETNRHIKNIMCYIILKAVAPQGVIHNYKKQFGYLAQVCQCSKQTIAKRIAWLEDQQLLINEGNDICLTGWKQAASLYELNLKEFKTVFYDYTTDKNIFLRLFAAEIETNKEQQAYMVKTKLKRNLALKLRVQAEMLRHGAKQDRLNDLDYLHNGMRLLYINSFKVEPEFHSLLCHVRPDCNRGVKGMATAWSFKNRQLVSYYKRKLADSEIAVVTKGERITSQCRARNEFSHTIWNKTKKQTVLSLVDSIVIIAKKKAA